MTAPRPTSIASGPHRRAAVRGGAGDPRWAPPVRAPRRPSSTAGLGTALVALALAACQGAGGGAADAAPAPWRPAPRLVGARLLDFAGVSPEARGWSQVDGLFWVPREEAGSWGRGLVLVNDAWTPAGEAPALATSAADGYLVRTDHVSLRTNARWRTGASLARAAEDHVRRVFAAWGDALDLRFPDGPLPVVVHARRAELVRALAGALPEGPAYGAFYDARTGVVHVCVEPAPEGALPVVADLRHELTHQILDLSSRRSGLATPPPHHLWLWEGFAVASETLGDTAGEDAGGLRRARLSLRARRGELEPLSRLFRLAPAEFEGRHYDEAGALVSFLLADGVPGGRRAVLDTLADLLAGHATAGDFVGRLGTAPAELERRWRASGTTGAPLATGSPAGGAEGRG